MKKLEKVLATILLMTMVAFATGCNNTSSFNGHEYVDLGLPSGTLWATCNVGASKPEDFGNYYAWGETSIKAKFNWDIYKYCNGSDDQLTKYCNDSDYGYNGFTDNLTTLLPEDDAATVNWGDGWCMPTADQWQELYENTTHTWTTQNGVNGRLFTSLNGNSLFLPAAGFWLSDEPDEHFRNILSGKSQGEIYFFGCFGFYWSSSLSTDNPNCAWDFTFYSDNYGMFSIGGRDSGSSVRAVRASR